MYKRLLLCFCVFSLGACGEKETIYMAEEPFESPMPEGYIGCVWKPYKKLKLNPPLTGHLGFNTLDCGLPPVTQFNREMKYSLDANNTLRVNGYPLPLKMRGKKGTPILSIITNLDDDEKGFMTRYLPSENPHCQAFKSENGEWSVGYSREYLESKGFQFLKSATSDLYEIKPPNSQWTTSVHSLSFPMDAKVPEACSEELNFGRSKYVVRFNQDLAFQFDVQFFYSPGAIDKGSIRIIR